MGARQRGRSNPRKPVIHAIAENPQLGVAQLSENGLMAVLHGEGISRKTMGPEPNASNQLSVDCTCTSDG